MLSTSRDAAWVADRPDTSPDYADRLFDREVAALALATSSSARPRRRPAPPLPLPRRKDRSL